MKEFGLAIIPSDDLHPAPEGHPECPTRLFGVMKELESERWMSLAEPLEKKQYSLKLLKTVHTPEYIDELASYSGVGVGYIDLDCFRSTGTFQASCQVTWALLSAVEASLGAGPKRSFIIGRPPGHHAGRQRPLGFCLVNHLAVAAQYLIDRGLGERVAIVDFDVHHGNGTQEIFYDRGDVLYVSSHQYPYYPGTGRASEMGTEAGEGCNVNLPFRAGLEDAELIKTYETTVADRVAEFAPDIILVTAGFDGHYLDPLGGFDLTGDAFNHVGAILRTLADSLCEGRLVSLMEGGYSPEGNLDGVRNYLEGKLGLNG